MARYQKKFLLLTLGLCLISVTFQNCSGFVVGNPIRFEKTQLRFAGFDSKVSAVDMCLTNVLLRVVEFTDESAPEVSKAASLAADQMGFDVSYFYFDPKENKYYIRGLLRDHQLRLDSTGTLIGDFNLPHAMYDMVSFGFAPCTAEKAPSVVVSNEFGEFADTPFGYFALPYSETRDLHNPAQNEFAIQYFTDGMARVNSEQAMLMELEPYRRFDLIGLASIPLPNHSNAFMDRLFLQPDQKTLAVGSAKDNNRSVVTMARYDQQGALDPTFGNGGYLSMRTEASAEGSSGIAVGPDKSIYVNRKVWLNGQSAIGVLKLKENGTPDPTFGENGWVKLNVSEENELCHDLLLLSDGSLLISATTRHVMDTTENKKELMVFKLTPTGTIDTSFATKGFFRHGYRVSDYSDRVMLALRSDNKIVVGFTENASPKAFWNVIRLHLNGTVDTSFGVEMPSRAKAYDMFLQPEDNKILFAGRKGLSQPYEYAAARVLADGGLDTGFGVEGRIVYDFGGNDIARGVIRRFNSVTNKFEVLISGQSQSLLGFGFALLILDDRGQIDTAAANGGTRIFMFNSPGATYAPMEGTTMGGPMLLRPSGELSIGGASPDLFHLLTVSY